MFIKHDVEAKVVHVANNSVSAPDYELLAENHPTYDYPKDGWYWADSAEVAVTLLFGADAIAKSVDFVKDVPSELDQADKSISSPFMQWVKETYGDTAYINSFV